MNASRLPCPTPRSRHTTLAAIALFGLLGLAGSAGAQPVQWSVDSSHSRVGFVARHLAFAKVRGKFGKFSARITADRATGRITALSATAKAQSVDTDNSKRDEHLRSDDFFAAKAHPELKLVLKSITWDGNDFKAKVALSIRGNTRDVDFKGSLLGVRDVNFGKGPHRRMAYEASATIDRKAFGLKFNGAAEGLSIVGDQIKIELELEASTK